MVTYASSGRMLVVLRVEDDETRDANDLEPGTFRHLGESFRLDLEQGSVTHGRGGASGPGCQTCRSER